MPTSGSLEVAISRIQDQSDFLSKLLIDELDWPISNGTQGIEDITYEWSLEELGASEFSGKVVDNRALQIRPPVDHQPWGIFLLEFTDERPFVTGRGMARLLRAVLDGLKPKRTRDAHLASWKKENLLFICTYQYRHFRFAYFKPPDNGSRSPQLATFGWEYGEPARTVCEFNLLELAWPHADVESDSAKWVKKWAKAFDVEKVTKHFFEDYKDVFEQVEELVTDLSDSEDRRLFTQLLFNRLLFLRFIERKGWLRFQGRTDYLRALYEAGGIGGESFYSSRIHPLFFEGLAVLGKQKSDAIGEVPYLNGGLFDKNPKLDSRIRDLPDIAFKPIIGERGLFYRYNFTVQESTPLDVEVAVDPEMLGKVFERLVTARERKEKGSYYTPRQIVSFMCRETLKGYLGGYEALIDNHDDSGISIREAKGLRQKLRELTVVDPACGSGAYLLGMLHELHSLHTLLDTRAEEATARDDSKRKLEIIEKNLYGVDIGEFAVNIACLRLWLSLAVEYEGDDPEPLPNLDFKIEVGDSLTAPDPSAVQQDLFHQPDIIKFQNRKEAYSGETDPVQKEALRAEIFDLRKRIAERTHPGVEVAGFDWSVEFAEIFMRKAAEATIDGELNLGEKLARVPRGGGFDIVIANPPYGAKVHDKVRNLLFHRNTQGAQSKDSYGIFIARALQLLRPGGQFSFIVSDTWRTIRTHRPLRRRLLDHTTVRHVLDLPSWVFEATVNTCILTLEKGKPADGHQLVAGNLCAILADDWDTLSRNLVAVAGRAPDVQTTRYVRYTYPQSLIGTYGNLSFFVGSPRLYQLMNDKRLKRLDDLADVKVGLQTGDNKHFLRKLPTAQGGYRLLDESQLLTEEEIANLTEDEKRNGVHPSRYAGRHFVLYDKGGASDAEGGWLPNYLVPTGYFIDWSREALRRLRAAADLPQGSSRKAYIRNEQYYFRRGVTFSSRGQYAPTFRLNHRSVFDKESSCIFPSAYPLARLLGMLCARPTRYLLKTFVEHTVSNDQSALAALPIPRDSTPQGQEIEPKVNAIFERQEATADYPYHLWEQKEIEELVFQAYEMNEDDRREVDLWFCRRYPKLARAQGLWDEVHEKYADHLRRCERILEKPPGYWKSHPILSMIAEGEGQGLEFKETLEADARTGQKYPTLVHEALRTVCAFANADGGTLLIGVSDDGEIKGLQKDYKLCGKRQNEDGFQQKLQNLVSSRLDPSPLDLVSISFEELPEAAVSRVDVQQSKDIIHLDKKEAWVRYGNQSRRLEGRELTDWIERRSSS